MGVYDEYLNLPLTKDFQLLSAERKKQLIRISQARSGRDILVFAADISKPVVGTSIEYADILPINDLIGDMSASGLDIILETPGGSGEVVEDIVRTLHSKYADIAVIVPGWAKSAGTLLTMAADEILMGPSSALGPIDAQITWQGKRFSADALLEKFDEIKKEVDDTGNLNKAYIPMLQGISPGELKSAQNALNFAKLLTEEWLAKYKFKNWKTHQTDPEKRGQPVTEDDKKQRAKEIAEKLGDHRKWLTHGRSINMADLTEMRLLITDYTKNAELNDAVKRYQALLQISFQTNLYKIFETTTSQVMKFAAPNVPAPPMLGPIGQPLAGARLAGAPLSAILDVKCGKCGNNTKVQADVGKKQPLQPSVIRYPKEDRLNCSSCGSELNLTSAKLQIEAQTKQRVITE